MADTDVRDLRLAKELVRVTILEPRDSDRCAVLL